MAKKKANNKTAVKKGKSWSQMTPQEKADVIWGQPHAKKFMQTLINRGVDPYTAAAIAGNVAVESNFDPNAHGRYKDKKGKWWDFYGLFQAQPELYRYITKYYGKSYDDHINFLIDGLNGKLINAQKDPDGRQWAGRFKSFNSAKKGLRDTEEVANLWDVHIERSGGQKLNERKTNSKTFFKGFYPNGYKGKRTAYIDEDMPPQLPVAPLTANTPVMMQAEPQELNLPLTEIPMASMQNPYEQINDSGYFLPQQNYAFNPAYGTPEDLMKYMFKDDRKDKSVIYFT